jgi:hypothetical protein
MLYCLVAPVVVAYFLPRIDPEYTRALTDLMCNPEKEQNSMAKPVLDYTQADNTDIFAFIGRVSLLLVEHNVDAITATTFLREIAEAGGGMLSLGQARRIAQNYVDLPLSRPAEREP